MINIHELRIDNWVDTPKPRGACQVNGIQLHSNKETYVWVYAEGMDTQHRVNIKDLEPIPLTPEILEKCGFKEVGTYYEIKIVSNILSIELPDGETNLKDDDGMICLKNETSHVHQLQNLYFALTGDELKIEL